MFILKRQDVEISSVPHPKRDQQIPILTYQEQTFRLIQVFEAHEAEEAKAFWRELTDVRGKFCILLEEPERHSIWGRIRLDQLTDDAVGEAKPLLYTQACLLLLQAVFIDIEDFLGNRQAAAFEKDLITALGEAKIPQAHSVEAVRSLLTEDPLKSLKIQPWQENHLIAVLDSTHRLGKAYFANTNFVPRALEVLEDMSSSDRTEFMAWLERSPVAQLWAT